MYAQLGNIIFETQFAFDSMSIDKSVNYAEHARVDSKPRLQAVGYNLDEISIGIMLHTLFCDVQKSVDEFIQKMENNEILAFVSGAGVVYGNFVITSFKQTFQQTADEGTLIEVNCDITLKEYVNDNLLEQQKQQKKANASAIQDPTSPKKGTPNKLQLSLQKAQLISATKEASLNVTKSISQASQVKEKVSKAKQGLISVQKTLKDVKKSVDDVYKKMDKIREYVTEYQNAYSNFQAILNSADFVKQNINTMNDAILTGDINQVFDANTNFQIAINRVARSGSSIASKASMRLPVKK